jgi:hypothetical protein
MVYTGQTGHSVETKVKEHHHHTQLYHLEKPAMDEHITNPGHHILLNDTSILAKKSGCMDRIIREVTEIILHANNMNRQDGFSLNRSKKPLIHKEWKKVLSKDETCTSSSPDLALWGL